MKRIVVNRDEENVILSSEVGPNVIVAHYDCSFGIFVLTKNEKEDMWGFVSVKKLLRGEPLKNMDMFDEGNTAQDCIQFVLYRGEEVVVFDDEYEFAYWALGKRLEE